MNIHATNPNPALAERLRTMADKLQSDIDSKFADRRMNTPKQQREAGAARIDGMHLERTQKALRALAAMHDTGTVPAALARITSKKAVHDLTKSKVNRSGGYYDAGYDTGEPYHDTDESRAIWALLDDNAERRAALELERKTAELKFAKIPGYFPTPAPVIAQMLEHARLAPSLKVLEPQAGSGAIVDAIREAEPTAEITLFEIAPRLREILEAKGHKLLVGSDFLESDTGMYFDRVVMNPPFEKGADMLHVQHAFDCLKHGGRLVAIMGPGFTFRSDAKSRAFRDWFYENGGEIVAELPSGTFKDSGTGVSTLMIVIDRT